MKALLAAALFVILGCASCATVPAGPAPSGSTAAASGIQGTVELGPTCPVERVGSPCPPRPISAAISVVAAKPGGMRLAGRSGSDGRFRIDLPAGTYTVTASATSAFQRGDPVTVEVRAGEFSTVTLRVDSGIR